MSRPELCLTALLACLALSGCAPIILGRTPQPAAPGAWAFSLNAGYPLLSPYPNDPFNGPAQTPTAQPVNLFLARGVGGATELSGALSVSISPSLRLGGKTLLAGGAVPLAADYGVSWTPPTGVGLDAGLLVSYPQPGVEPYGGLRGFFSSGSSVSSAPNLAGSLTLGADVPAGSGSFFFELTAATTTFETYSNPATPPLPPLGFSLVPALGYRF